MYPTIYPYYYYFTNRPKVPIGLSDKKGFRSTYQMSMAKTRTHFIKATKYMLL